MRKEVFEDKAKKHVSWELFWKIITFTLIGLVIFIYSLINIVNNKTSILSIIGLIMGILIFIYGVFAIKRNYKKNVK
ncbi:hypothetical protein HYT23_04000 [Candidatus Pacearchaeota archaeon]|nr:hypothetical protein [Candidatus Pacearchaeota archaeon]